MRSRGSEFVVLLVGLLGPGVAPSKATPPVAMSQSQLLAGRDRITAGRTQALYPTPEDIEVYLQYTEYEPVFEYVEIGRGVFWEDGSSGTVDFTAGNALEYLPFVSHLTNGVDEELAVAVDQMGILPMESGVFWSLGDPDLAGKEIDFIRLIVNKVTTTPWSDPPIGLIGYEWTADFRWEFWGHAVPEPAAFVMLAFGSSICIAPHTRFEWRQWSARNSGSVHGII